VRRPKQIECLYLDFDGFFASVEQTAHPQLRGLPVGVVPFAARAVSPAKRRLPASRNSLDQA
jgi:nucleotidyltransferase/DNA polymerase involved in DNA repair